MIVDFHVHLARYDTMTPSFVDLLRRQWGENWAERIRPFATPEGFLQLMDRCGIDFAVILAELAPITTGIAGNDTVAEFCKTSQRLIPFASVDPSSATRPAEELRRLVTEQGFRGLKLYPTYQHYYPNEARIYPMYSVAQELGIPVLVHVGSSVFAGSRLKYGDPLFLDDVAVDFPTLTIIQSHCGRPFWYDKAFALARLHENVYMEVAGLPPRNLLSYFPELERLSSKVIYGSDWPGVPTIQENIRHIRELPLSQECKNKILGGNASKILSLPPCGNPLGSGEGKKSDGRG
jgi:predicted TIM-barrel fold metal-dependent hydrolase